MIRFWCMPPQAPNAKVGIQWNKVTWYSKILAITLFVVFVCGAFFFGIWYQTQKQKAIAVVPVMATKTEQISYPAGFAEALSQISTDDWKVYQDKNGWQIKYPGNWNIADCDGAVHLAQEHTSAVTCDGPDPTAFIIVGPTSQNQAAYKTDKARIALKFDLNGVDATRYLDALSGQTGTDFSEIVTLEHNNSYYSVFFENVANDLIAEKILSTFSFTQ